MNSLVHGESGAPAAPAEGASVWWYAAGYFACYVPYVTLTKLLSVGELAGGRKVAGIALLPISALASSVAMIAFITARGWWRHADRRRVGSLSIPVPDLPTAASGVATAAIIATTTLSYAVPASVLAMMVLMRGGVLVLAPIVDFVSGRAIRGRSWGALGLCLAAVAIGLWGAPGGSLDATATIVVALYLVGYFVRLGTMSARGKSEAREAGLRFFVREQMVAAPTLIVLLAAAALTPTAWGAELRAGFTMTFDAGAWLIVIGLLSQGTGTFGALVLLDARENAFCVPLNRASSVLAGLVAALGMTAAVGTAAPRTAEIVAAALLVGALVWLGWPSRSAARAAG